MHEDEILPFLENHSLFAGLNPEQYALLVEQVEIRHYKPNKVIVKEKDASRDLYILFEGEVNILKWDEKRTEQFKIGSLVTGDLFGELSFIDGMPRSTTVKTTKDTVVLSLKYQVFHEALPAMKEIIQVLTSNVAKINTQRLRSANEDYVMSLRKEVEHFKLRTQFGQFFIYILLLLGIGFSLNQYVETHYVDLRKQPNIFSWTYLIVLVLPIAIMAKSFHYTLRDVGVTLIGWKKSLIEGLIIGGVLAVIFLSLAWFYVNVLNGQRLPSERGPITVLVVASYFTHAYLQELMSRGIVQTTLQRFYEDERGIKTVVIVSALFGIFHTHISLKFAALTFFGSLIFGFIYLRHRNLIGVTIVHTILGTCARYLGLM